MPIPFNPKFFELEGFIMRWSSCAPLLIMSSEYDIT